MDLSWLQLVDALVAVPVLLGVLLVAVTVRRRLLLRPGGTFDASVRWHPRTGSKGWKLGFARYAGDHLEWFRLFSLLPRPRHRIVRRELAIAGRRDPSGPESYVLPTGAVVMQFRQEGRAIEIGLSEAALTGFLAWLESAPPGQHKAA